jgi:serine/threonine protein kinase
MGKTKFDGRKADVWSLGVILCIMVTGHLPWGSRHVPRLLGEIRRGEYEVPDNVTPGCLDLIRKLMQPCANDRIGLGEAVNHPWLAGIQLRQMPWIARRVISLRRLDECFVKNDVFEPRTVFVPRRRSKSFDQPDFVRMGDILSRKFPERELVVDERPEGRASRRKGSTLSRSGRLDRPQAQARASPPFGSVKETKELTASDGPSAVAAIRIPGIAGPGSRHPDMARMKGQRNDDEPQPRAARRLDSDSTPHSAQAPKESHKRADGPPPITSTSSI